VQPNEDIQAARRLLASHYLKRALGTTSDIPWNVASKLLDTGLFKMKEVSHPLDEQLLAAISALAARTSESEAPVLIFLEKDEKTGSIPFLELAECLASRNVSVAAAVAPVIARSVRALTRGSLTTAPVLAYEKAVLESDISRILPAAAELYEALLVDWGWQNAMLSQSSRAGLFDIARRQLEVLLRFNPAEPETLGFLQEHFATSLSEIARVEAAGVIDDQNIRDYIDGVGPYVAHLPLRVDCGFGSLISRISTADTLSIAWELIGRWVHDAKPAWWFHIWSVAMANPKAVPADLWDTLWARIQLLTAGGSAQEHSDPALHLSIYERLFSFFYYRCEVALPTTRSDFIFYCSSMLASDATASLSASRQDNIIEVLDAVKEEAELVWQISSPTFVANELRSAFLDLRRYWPLGIQRSIEFWDDKIQLKTIPDAAMAAFEDMLRAATARLTASHDRTDGLMAEVVMPNLSSISMKWREVFPPSSDIGNWFDAYAGLVSKFTATDELVRQLGNPNEGDSVEGIVAITRWSNLIRGGVVSLEDAYALLSKPDWLTSVEPTISAPELERILLGVLNAPAFGKSALRIDFAHWCARRAQDTSQDIDRCRMYCLLTLLMSLRGGTYSAIARLLHRDSDQEVAKRLRDSATWVTKSFGAAPAWVKGRIGSVLATLEI
jgi:hypothetical protein